MEFAVTAQIRNKPLFEAVQKFGGQMRLAEHLGIAVGTLGKWLNLKETPDLKRNGGKWEEKIGRKLFELTSCTLEEIFPPELCSNKHFLQQEKRVTRYMETSPERLMADGFIPKQLPSAEISIEYDDVKEQIKKALNTLTPREEKVIKMRFGLNEEGKEYPHCEIAEHLRLSGERIRQIEAKTLEKLRQPDRSPELKEAYNFNFDIVK